MDDTATPHDGAQSQLDDSADADSASADSASADSASAGTTSADPRQQLSEAPPVPTSGEKTADSGRAGTSPPGVRAGNDGLPSVAAPGKPDGEVDTRR